MTVRKAEGFIASDQTGKFPRMSNKGNQYICVFYIYDPNFIKGISIKSRKKEELLKAYSRSTSGVNGEVLNHNSTRWIIKLQKMWRTSSPANKPNNNTLHQTCIGLTQQKKHCKRISAALNQPLLRYLLTSLSHTGADYSHKST